MTNDKTLSDEFLRQMEELYRGALTKRRAYLDEHWSRSPRKTFPADINKSLLMKRHSLN